MTPVILLTDGALGNGTEIFRIPKVAELPAIVPHGSFAVMLFSEALRE